MAMSSSDFDGSNQSAVCHCRCGGRVEQGKPLPRGMWETDMLLLSVCAPACVRSCAAERILVCASVIVCVSACVRACAHARSEVVDCKRAMLNSYPGMPQPLWYLPCRPRAHLCRAAACDVFFQLATNGSQSETLTTGPRQPNLKSVTVMAHTSVAAKPYY
jgi:hypothetical protein